MPKRAWFLYDGAPPLLCGAALPACVLCSLVTLQRVLSPNADGQPNAPPNSNGCLPDATHHAHVTPPQNHVSTGFAHLHSRSSRASKSSTTQGRCISLSRVSWKETPSCSKCGAGRRCSYGTGRRCSWEQIIAPAASGEAAARRGMPKHNSRNATRRSSWGTCLWLSQNLRLPAAPRGTCWWWLRSQGQKYCRQTRRG